MNVGCRAMKDGVQVVSKWMQVRLGSVDGRREWTVYYKRREAGENKQTVQIGPRMANRHSAL